MKIKKLLSLLLTAAIFVASVMCFTVTASADGIESTSKSVDSGEAFSVKLNDTSLKKVYHDYKIKLSEDGDLKVYLNGSVGCIYVVVYDANGDRVSVSISDSNAETGVIGKGYTGYDYCKWNKTLEKFKGTLMYKDLKKGTYYIRIYKGIYDKFSGSGKTTVKFTYPQAGSSSTQITGLQLTLTKGSEAALSALLSGSGEVTWSSSKKSVATVSKSGKVKAVDKGTAVITAKCGDSSAKITIKVS